MRGKVLCLLAVVLLAHAACAEEEQKTEGNYNNDYKEDKNHSEAIQRILRDFEKTLEDNKLVFERPDVVDDEVEVIESSSNETTAEELESSPDLTTLTATNSTEENVTESAEGGGHRARMVCNNTLPAEGEATPGLRLLPGGQLQAAVAAEHNASVANRSSPALCSATLFFADWCPFSATAAPHYNALARAFPHLPLYAVDSSRHHSLNTHYGVMAVPTILVFHNSKPLYKYNYTEYSLDKFVEFISLVTGLEAANGTEVTAADLEGPVVGRVVEQTNPYLWLALAFSLSCGLLHFSKTRVAGQLLAWLAAAWREAEIQHEHTD